jgi:hypothetical protein
MANWEDLLPPNVRDWLPAAREAAKRGDWETARMAYQKCAYGNAGNVAGDAARAREMLIQEQTRFAGNDPLHRDTMARIQAVVAAEPGIKQTELYKRIAFTKETIASAPYFGELLGQVRREKQGRTYAVFPGGVRPG